MTITVIEPSGYRQPSFHINQNDSFWVPAYSTIEYKRDDSCIPHFYVVADAGHYTCQIVGPNWYDVQFTQASFDRYYIDSQAIPRLESSDQTLAVSPPSDQHGQDLTKVITDMQAELNYIKDLLLEQGLLK